MGGLLAAGTAAAPVLSACGSSSASGADLSGTSLSVATVSNSQMEDMASLIGHFTEQSGIEVEFQFLPENALRQRVTQDAAMRAGNYDVVTIGSYKVRLLLAALVLEAGHVVSVDGLIDRLWDGDPPNAALVTLRAYVSNLRSALPDGHTRIVTRPGATCSTSSCATTS